MRVLFDSLNGSAANSPFSHPAPVYKCIMNLETQFH